MVRVGGFLKSQNRIRRQRARGRFVSPYQVGGTIFGKSTTARYPLMHTSSRLVDPMILKQVKRRRQMKGGTIFGTSTRMRRSRDPMQVLMADQDKARQRRWLQQRMKGGDLRKVLWANQRKARKQRMKGGNIFSQLKERIQIDFPHRPFPSAHPVHDWYRMRKGIKRGRR